MKFYEYIAKPDLSDKGKLKEFFSILKEMEFCGVGIVKPRTMSMSEYMRIVNKLKKYTDIVSVLEISNPKDVKRIKTMRKRFDVIVARNMGLEANRIAIETEGLDILLSPYTDNELSFNYVMAKIAGKNNVRIGFSFKDLIYTEKERRANIFKNMLETAKFAKKAKCKIVITSEPVDKWDVRSYSEFIALGRILGFQDPSIKEGISGQLVETNREKVKNL